MNNERYNQIIDEAYEKYKKHIETQEDIQKKEVQRLRSQGKKIKVVKIILLTKEEFITKCKTDPEFSERWGLRIEVRELNTVAERKRYDRDYEILIVESKVHHDRLDNRGVPRKIVTVTYKEETKEVYE